MKKKQLICSALAAAMLLGSTAPTAGAAQFPDSVGHWSASAIDRWSNYGVVVGANGLFNPDASITRGEMASIIAGMMGLEEVAANRYPDLNGGWYSTAMLKCVAAGIMTGDDHGQMRPYDNITGAEIAVMLTKALDLDSTGYSSSYPAANTGYVKPWAQGYVNALASRGISIGNDGGMFQPMENTSRAAVVSMFDRAVGTYIKSPGTYTASGLTIINTTGTVTLRGSASGVIVTNASDCVKLTLDNTRVTGSIDLRAEEAQLTATDAKLSGDITVQGAKSQISLSGSTEAGNITLTSAAEESTVTLARSASAGMIETSAEDTEISVSGKVDSIDLRSGASSSEVEVMARGVVTSLTSAANKVTISGDGDLKRATISGNNNSIDTPDTTVKIQSGVSGTKVDGVLKSSGSTSSSGSSSSSSSSSSRYTITYRLATTGANSSFKLYDSKRVYRSDYASDLRVPDSAAPEGYQFKGWYTNSRGTKLFDFDTRIRDDYTLYGFWEKAPKPVDPTPPTNPSTPENPSDVLKAALKESLKSIDTDGKLKSVGFPTSGDVDCRLVFNAEYPMDQVTAEIEDISEMILEGAKQGKAKSLTVCKQEIDLTAEDAKTAIVNAITTDNQEKTAPNIDIELTLKTSSDETITYVLHGAISYPVITTAEGFMAQLQVQYVHVIAVGDDIIIDAEANALTPICEKKIDIDSGTLTFTKVSELPSGLTISSESAEKVIFVPQLQAAARDAFKQGFSGGETLSMGTNFTVSGTAEKAGDVAGSVLNAVNALKTAQNVTDVKVNGNDANVSSILGEVEAEAAPTELNGQTTTISFTVCGVSDEIRVTYSGIALKTATPDPTTTTTPNPAPNPAPEG